MADDGDDRAGSGLGRAELERVWRRERRWVAAVLLAHMPRGESLEDLLQEVALAVVRHGGELRDRSSLRPWLRTIALNVARGAGRRSQIRRRHGLEGDGSERRVDVESLVDPAGGARGDRDLHEAAERVLGLAEELPPDYREPLLLRCVRGLSQRRIAELLDLPETTVETRLVRARRRLREAWSRQRDCAETDWES